MGKQDLIFSKEFSTYRQAEFDEAAKVVEDLFKSNCDPAYIKGALDMLKRIINIPIKFAGSKEAEEAAMMMVDKDFKTFKTKFIRGFLDD